MGTARGSGSTSWGIDLVHPNSICSVLVIWSRDRQSTFHKLRCNSMLIPPSGRFENRNLPYLVLKIIIFMQAFSIQQPQKQQFVEYKYRWVVVCLFGLSIITNAIASNTVSPIASKLAQTYGVGKFVVNSIAMIFLFLYTIMNFPANYIIDLKGLRVGLLFGTVLICIGFGIEMMVNASFYFVLVGTVLIAAGQPFIINCPAKIAAFWFKKENRPFATSLLTAINLIGIGVGVVTPALIVKENSVGEKAKDQVFYLFMTEFIISACAMILVSLFMKAQPPTAASKGAQAEKTPFKQAVKTLFKDVQFRKLFAGFVFFYGTLLTFAAIVNFLFKPYGFSDIQISLFGIGMLFCGVAGSIMLSLYVKKTLKYRFVFQVCTGAALVITILTTLMLNTKPSVFLSLVCVSFMGFLVTPILPLTYDVGCEIAFPVGQALVTGILNGGGMIFSFALIGFIQLAIGMGTQKQSMAIMITMSVIMGIGAIFYWWLKPTLKRREHEHEQGQTKPNEQGNTTPAPKDSTEPEADTNRTNLSEPEKRYVQFRDESA